MSEQPLCHVMDPTQHMFAAARDTAEAAARREMERADDWTDWVDAALALAGDHSMPLAEHTGRAMRGAQGCTGIAAHWCPIHGDCACDRGDTWMGLDDPSCPLHAAGSDHAEAGDE